MSLIEPPAPQATEPAFDAAAVNAVPAVDTPIASRMTRSEVAAGGEFLPLRWLRNPHIQSIYPSLPLLRPGLSRTTSVVAAASQRVILDCDDGVRLLAFQARQHESGRKAAQRLAVLLHGWEGSSSSLYVLSLAQHLFDRGYDVVRLNLRDHGDSHDLNAELFHSNRIAEVTSAVQRVQRLNPRRDLHLVGFSLGGNFCLRVGARAARAGIDLKSVVAVCPVLDPARTLAGLEHGWAVYRRYFVSKWRRSLRRKREAWPNRYDFNDMLRMPSLTEMTDYLVRKYTDYPSLEQYLQGYAIVGEALRTLEARSRVIAAMDDPIIPAADLDRLPSLPALEITRTRFGGHCGYFDGRPGPSWLEREIAAELERGALD